MDKLHTRTLGTASQGQISPETQAALEHLAGLDDAELRAIVIQVLNEQARAAVPRRPAPRFSFANGFFDGLAALSKLYEPNISRRRSNPAGLHDDWAAMGRDLKTVFGRYRQDAP